MQQPRTVTREYAIILFCVVGIAAINAWANNRFVVDFNAMYQTVMGAFGRDGIKRGYERMTLYELLDKHASDPQAVQALKGVAVEGQILRERAIDPDDPNFTQAEKVGTTFRLSRRFSETGIEEDAHVISVEVNYPKPEGLEANMWVLVQGPVRTIEEGENAGAPIIDAVAVTKMRMKPENDILTPEGVAGLPGQGLDMHGHDHDHGHEGHGH